MGRYLVCEMSDRTAREAWEIEAASAKDAAERSAEWWGFDCHCWTGGGAITATAVDGAETHTIRRQGGPP